MYYRFTRSSVGGNHKKHLRTSYDACSAIVRMARGRPKDNGSPAPASAHPARVAGTVPASCLQHQSRTLGETLNKGPYKIVSPLCSERYVPRHGIIGAMRYK